MTGPCTLLVFVQPGGMRFNPNKTVLCKCYMYMLPPIRASQVDVALQSMFNLLALL
jgi:hypothetical protein